MIKIDLVTGFLGSGKTTFIKKYAKYQMSKGERVCILENDYGAINIDMMLVNDIGCDMEMVAGGCDYDCHMRRFKTKLISMAMQGYTRVIVEPSGVYDTDEFFDTLYEDPISNWYEIGNIFFIYDVNTANLSDESEYLLVSQASVCGKLIATKGNDISLEYINLLMKKYMCDRSFDEKDVLYFDDINMSDIDYVGYNTYDHIKVDVNDNNKFDSVYLMDMDITLDKVNSLKKLFKSSDVGHIIRIKGFIFENNKWTMVNITRDECDISDISNGQRVVIVIGENLDKNKILEVVL